jgi:hypothetical protein
MAAVIAQELLDRNTGWPKPPIQGLAAWAVSLLACRSVNTAERLSVLPRQTKEAESRYRYLQRWLKNSLIDPRTVRGGFIPEMALLAGSHGKTIVLPMDQSKISDGFECLLVSMRMGERAMPVAWKVKQTSAGICFAEQKSWLETIFARLPEGAPVWLAPALTAQLP